MQHIKPTPGEQARSRPSSPNPKPANLPRKSREEIHRLFESLQGIFGNQFGSRFSTKAQVNHAVEEWRFGLGPYSNETISEVILNLRADKTNIKNCPHLLDFVGICKTVRARQLALEAHAAAERARELRRPRTPLEIKTAESAIATMRKAVNHARG